ncbi:MAG: 50S ribosomal protein L3, partial [Candidatus Aenigmarchaeota archaeon]|nr:50S ribosomal protein L3 [Candidatus Aenigmarchaeota archaeon]
MPKVHKPVAGSRGFWPKKRAKRIYPKLKVDAKSDKPVSLGFAAYKAGMATILYADTRKESSTRGLDVAMPVTVLDAPPLKITGIKLYRTTPYGMKDAGTIMADSLSKDLDRKTKATTKDTKGKLEQAEKALATYSDLRLLA